MISKIKKMGFNGLITVLKILIALLVIFNIENYNLVVYLFLVLALIS